MYVYKFTVRSIDIVLVGDEEGLSQLMIDNNTKEFHIDSTWRWNAEPFVEAERQLREYFAGQRTVFSLKLNPKGTEFQKKIWKELAAIPYGSLYSYKQIAIKIGNPNASRAVGMANNKNPIPIVVPCHRVVGANKKLVGYAYGLELKQQLIDLEIVTNSFLALANYYGSINKPAYDGGQSWWPSSTAFEMMIGSILVQNTNWKNVDQALQALGPKLSPQYINELSNDELAALIRPSGYHNQKAKKIKALVEWFSNYSFTIELAKEESTNKLRKELLSVHGIGPETADDILVYVLKKPSFIIDTYTRRIFTRIGIAVPSNYDEFRLFIEQLVAKDVKTYDYYHGLLVEHAQAFCLKTPKCDPCPLGSFCKKIGV